MRRGQQTHHTLVYPCFKSFHLRRLGLPAFNVGWLETKLQQHLLLILAEIADDLEMHEVQHSFSEESDKLRDDVVQLNAVDNEALALAEHLRYLLDRDSSFVVEVLQRLGFFHRVDVLTLKVFDDHTSECLLIIEVFHYGLYGFLAKQGNCAEAALATYDFILFAVFAINLSDGYRLYQSVGFDTLSKLLQLCLVECLAWVQSARSYL